MLLHMLTNSPKLKDVQFNIIKKREKLQILTIEKLEMRKILLDKRLQRLIDIRKAVGRLINPLMN